jgi:hypothetical protein
VKGSRNRQSLAAESLRIEIGIMRVAKQIVYRYNGDPGTEEIDLDMDGDKSVPKQGSVVERKGGRWKVTQVNVERNAAEPFEVPIHRVFLTNE